MEWKAAPDARFSDKDAEVLGRRFERLAEHGPITAETVVEDARSVRSPIHPYFEWDDPTAAAEYRRNQARYYLRHVMVIREPDTEPIRAYHVVVVKRDADDPGTSGYVPLARVLSDNELLRQVIESERRVLSGCRRRISQYESLRGAADALAAVVDMLAMAPVAVGGGERA